MTSRSFFLSAFAIGCLAAASPVDAAPNLSGEWKLNSVKSGFGAVPAPEVMMRTIKHQDPSLKISTYQKGAQGEVRTELDYTTDGKECVNRLQGSETKGTAKWEGENLIVESTRDFQGKEIKSKETWTLSEGGKVLTIYNHLTVPQTGEFDIKLVFDKQ